MASEHRQRAAAYYSALTSLYQWYGGEAEAWHYGIHDSTVSSRQAALVRANALLLDGVPSAGAPIVVDVGCGEGGLSVWAAEHGYRAVGITVVPEHATIAYALAASRGVAERCRFFVADMDALALRHDSVDVVINQEAMCHSAEKEAYVRAVRVALRPGGWFRSLDFAIRPGARSAREDFRYRATCDGFEIPSLVSGPEMREYLKLAGFTGITIEDLTPLVLRSALVILGGSIGFHFLTKVGLDWIFYGRVDPKRSRYRRHVSACVAFNVGLLRGPFRYLRVSARKPG